jgi:hypothetical protein
MMMALGLVLLGLSIALIKITKARELAGSRFWTMAARSVWLPILFTAMFGLGFVSLIGGVVKLVGV